jgi:hypothetical protein
LFYFNIRFDYESVKKKVTGNREQGTGKSRIEDGRLKIED